MWRRLFPKLADKGLIVPIPDNIERNVAYRSTLTGQFYFAPKVRILDEKTRVVIGKKFDITDQIEPYLLKRYRTVRQ